MNKIALILVVCVICAVAGYRVYAEAGEPDKSAKESELQKKKIVSLEARIMVLEQRITDLEKRLRDTAIIKLPRPSKPKPPIIPFPMIQPRPENLPKGSVPRYFNGKTFYIVPIEQSAK